MNVLMLILSTVLLASNAQAYEVVNSGLKEVVSHLHFAKVKVDVACVYTDDGEGEGRASLFFSPVDFPKVKKLQDSGLKSAALEPREFCGHPEAGGTLPYYIVRPFTPATEIDMMISRGEGYSEREVVLYDGKTLRDGYRQQVKSTLEALF